MLFASRATASDFSGSAIILVSMNLHLAHPKVRFSKPSFRLSDRISAIRIEHREQRGCSIAARLSVTCSINESMTHQARVT
jgi:hypothetical protein